MNIQEEVNSMKQDINQVKSDSFAMELLKDYRKMNKRLFIVIITILCMWFATIGVGIYYITHYTYEEEIITETANTDTGGNACVGDRCNNGEIHYGDSNESN